MISLPKLILYLVRYKLGFGHTVTQATIGYTNLATLKRAAAYGLARANGPSGPGSLNLPVPHVAPTVLLGYY